MTPLYSTLGTVLALWAAAATPPTTLREDWFDFSFHGKKVGYLYARDQKVTVAGQPAFLAHRLSSIEVRRQDDVVRMKATTDVWFAPSGRPLRFRHERSEGAQKRRVSGDRKGDQLVVRVEVGAQAETRRVPVGKDLYFAQSLDFIARQNLRDGFRLSGRAFVEEEGHVRPFQLAVIARPDGFEIQGEIGGIKSHEFVGPKGASRRVEVPGLGAVFKAVDQASAVRMGALADIFSAGHFSVETALPPGPEIAELVLSLKTQAADRVLDTADRRQRVTKLGAQQLKMAIVPARAPRRRRVMASVASKFLEGTPFESLKDPALVRASRKAVAGAKDPWEKARRINRFVYRHLKQKNLSQAFSSASEALASGQGDCTEHAVLFSALAKIAGIPTRLVTGLVYVGGPRRIFGYHEWVEVAVGEEWVAMDPTFGQDTADATHIKIADGRSDPDGLREAGLLAAMVIGDLKLSVRSVQRRR